MDIFYFKVLSISISDRLSCFISVSSYLIFMTYVCNIFKKRKKRNSLKIHFFLTEIQSSLICARCGGHCLNGCIIKEPALYCAFQASTQLTGAAPGVRGGYCPFQAISQACRRRVGWEWVRLSGSVSNNAALSDHGSEWSIVKIVTVW